MAGITLDQAQAQLDAWLDASLKVSQRQSYSIGTRSLTFADLGEIQSQIKFWDTQVKSLTATNGSGGIRVRGLTLG